MLGGSKEEDSKLGKPLRKAQKGSKYLFKFEKRLRVCEIQGILSSRNKSKIKLLMICGMKSFVIQENHFYSKQRDTSTSRRNNITKTKSQKMHISDEIVIVPRDETIFFDKELCLFCQVAYPNESLYSVYKRS